MHLRISAALHVMWLSRCCKYWICKCHLVLVFLLYTFFVQQWHPSLIRIPCPGVVMSTNAPVSSCSIDFQRLFLNDPFERCMGSMDDPARLAAIAWKTCSLKKFESPIGSHSITLKVLLILSLPSSVLAEQPSPA